METEIDRYLLASRTKESIVYRIGEVFEEVRGTEFNPQGGTIAAGTLLRGAVWAQIVSGEVRIYDRGNFLRNDGNGRNSGSSINFYYG